MDVKDLKKKELTKLFQVYVYIKAMKSLLSVKGVKSYFVKKILLREDFMLLAKSDKVFVDELLYQAMMHPYLRFPFVKAGVDFAKWRMELEGMKGGGSCKLIPIKATSNIIKDNLAHLQF